MKPTFDEWLRAVDEQCWRRGGMALSDLPDIDYRVMYEHGVSPRNAASRALRNAGE